MFKLNRASKASSSKVLTLMRVGRIAKVSSKYKVMPYNLPQEIREMIIAGCKARKIFGIKRHHIDEALREVRKLG